uniref:Photosystem II reaction center PsbP family protein n=1 Tax=Pelargonium incrassatum TaxID=163034 RepID=A0A0F7H142_9ROSI
MYQSNFHAFKAAPLHGRIYMSKSANGPKDESFEEVKVRPPAAQFAPLASRFERRFLLGIGSASVVAVGANFCGITSFLLGLLPQTGRNLKLDVLYPIQGYSRCIDTNEGFEFIYPVNWVGDQTLLYRAAGKAESQRSLDLPPLNSANRPRLNVNEPVVAFGPPASTGELNVSVIVSPISLHFSIEAFGGPQEVGEALVRTIAGSSRVPNVKGTLIVSKLRADPTKMVKYYELEYRVESPRFERHNIAVCCVRNGRLYTLNAQAPESAWPEVESDIHVIANSFSLTS